jgi:hypothetical protein
MSELDQCVELSWQQPEVQVSHFHIASRPRNRVPPPVPLSVLPVISEKLGGISVSSSVRTESESDKE